MVVDLLSLKATTVDAIEVYGRQVTWEAVNGYVSGVELDDNYNQVDVFESTVSEDDVESRTTTTGLMMVVQPYSPSKGVEEIRTRAGDAIRKYRRCYVAPEWKIRDNDWLQIPDGATGETLSYIVTAVQPWYFTGEHIYTRLIVKHISTVKTSV